MTTTWSISFTISGEPCIKVRPMNKIAVSASSDAPRKVKKLAPSLITVRKVMSAELNTTFLLAMKANSTLRTQAIMFAQNHGIAR